LRMSTIQECTGKWIEETAEREAQFIQRLAVAVYPDSPQLQGLYFRESVVRGQLKPAKAGHFKTGHFEGLHLGRR